MAARARQRRQLPLPPQLASGTRREKSAGSASRPGFERIELSDELDLAIVELGEGQNAEGPVRPEDRDRNHEGLCELEGAALGYRRIVSHRVKARSGSGPIPARWLRRCQDPDAITMPDRAR